MLKRKRRVLLVAVLALVLGLGLTGSAGAHTDVGFHVDCTGAWSYGWVAEHDFVSYDVRLWDPDTGRGGNYWCDAYWRGKIHGPAPLNPTIEWLIPITGGTGENDPYYWVYLNGQLVQEGHFDCAPPPPPGGSCTPGYWRNLRKHGDKWEVAGISPEEDFEATFGVGLFDPNINLGEATRLGGGGVKKLARHGAAAYLNALHPPVDYTPSHRRR